MELKQNDGVSHMTGYSVVPMVKRKDSLSGTGTVFVRQFKMVDGEKVYLDDPPFRCNLIVSAGRATLIDLLVGAKRRVLTYIRWGKGGAASFPDGDPLEPYDVEDQDENVRLFLLDKKLNAYKRVSPTEIEYTETLICDEVNDDVNEAAMMFEDQDTKARTIFARITFPTIRLKVEKGTGIELRWIFNFNKAEEEIV